MSNRPGLCQLESYCFVQRYIPPLDHATAQRASSNEALAAARPRSYSSTANGALTRAFSLDASPSSAPNKTNVLSASLPSLLAFLLGTYACRFLCEFLCDPKPALLWLDIGVGTATRVAGMLCKNGENILTYPSLRATLCVATAVRSTQHQYFAVCAPKSHPTWQLIITRERLAYVRTC